MAEGNDEWINVAAVVERLRAAGHHDSVRTVQRMADEGTLTAYRTRGRQRRISTASVDTLIRSRETGSPPPPAEASGQPTAAAPPEAVDPATVGEREPTQQG